MRSFNVRSQLLRQSQLRSITTGENYSYRPGPVAKFMRSVYLSLTPAQFKKKIAVRMQKGMEETKALEKEQMWLKKHGSPLTVMGLPDHAELAEVKARYRNLVLETHPDTSTRKGGSSLDESEFAILQTAYQMAIQPRSLWHRNGSAPMLYQQLLTQSKKKVSSVNKITAFAVFSYVLMALIGIFFSAVIVSNGLEAALKFFDPEFYHFMIKQEKEEARKREAGEYVDTDPKRLAPKAVRKLLYPGRYIHGDADEPTS